MFPAINISEFNSQHNCNQQHVCSDQHFQHFWITHGPTLLCSHSKNSDVDKFIALARLGKVYEYFALMTEGVLNEGSRKEAKKTFITAIYGKYNQMDALLLLDDDGNNSYCA